MKRLAKMIFDGDEKNKQSQNPFKIKHLSLISFYKKNKKDTILAILCVCCSVLAVILCFWETKQEEDYLQFSQYFEKQTENENKNIYSLLGSDPRGEAYLTKSYVVRTIVPSYLDIAKKTFKKYKEFKKENLDIVETKMEESNFIHKRYITTYPHEWTANMIKDAIIFDLNLALKLRKYGLLLVDFALRNNVFNYIQPIYVDFHGVIADDVFANGKTELFIKDKNSKMATTLELKQLEFEGLLSAIKSFLKLSCNDYEQARKMTMIPYETLAFMQEKVNDKWGLIKELNSRKPATKIYESLANSIKHVPVGSNPHQNQYPFNYYKYKHENFDYKNRINWKPKQNSIFEILNKYKPETVLDIGCNTGWFSILAEHLGAKVISIDADEACVDNLYLYSKEHKLNILPLKINFEDLDKKYIYKKYSYVNRKESFKSKELYAAPILRLKSDMTLCLALVHHLILAYGMGIEKVMNILARITNKVLVVEIPNLQDPLIRGNLPYYRYAEDATSDQYSIDRFIEEGWKYFKKIEIYQSHPKTRKIIVFER